MKSISFRSYLKTQLPCIMIVFSGTIILILFMLAFHVVTPILILTPVMSFIMLCLNLVVDYLRRYRFYAALLDKIHHLDQAYLALEMLEAPGFYDGKILYEAFLKTNKSMFEQVEKYRQEVKSFQEYIELWLHEVKTPLATLTLITNNRKITEQLKLIDGLVEQVLYYVRAENSEQDYLIKNYDLEELINHVIMHNQTLLLASNIEVVVKNAHHEVFTDAKWCEFMFDQIVTNSFKYHSHRICFTATKNQQSTILEISDDGIGINKKDLPRIFDKSFTGENGHQKAGVTTTKSTGLGLYLVKQLCDKLGHKVSVSSDKGHGTTIKFEFMDHDYYNVIHDNLTKK